MPKNETVFIVGASDNPERYAYKAYQKLVSAGHKVMLINPRLNSVEGEKVYHSVLDAVTVTPSVDTVTVYVNPSISSELSDELVKISPKRVIFNPGSENPKLAKELTQKGIRVEEACTLVLLSTGQF